MLERSGILAKMEDSPYKYIDIRSGRVNDDTNVSVAKYAKYKRVKEKSNGL